MSKLNDFGGQWLISDTMVEESEGSFAIFDKIHTVLHQLQDRIDQSSVTEIRDITVEFNPSNKVWGYNLRVKALCKVENNGEQSR